MFENKEQRVRFYVLVCSRIVPSRYVDEPTLESLGLLTNVGWMFDQLGWRHFLSPRHRTYIRPTLEYFSSVELELGKRMRGHFGTVSFRLFNNDHEFFLYLKLVTSLNFLKGREKESPQVCMGLDTIISILFSLGRVLMS